jgi:CheY-like chemotaxis protein
VLLSAEVTSEETYTVACVNCQSPFNALDAAWCSCIVSERTLVCPSCLTCFCKGPASYKKTFWSAAPKTLWDRKFQEHHAAYAPPTNPAPENTKRPLVLLVDDEQDIQRVAAHVIESLGYGMVLGRNGEEGLALARLYHPDLVLSDALMPKMDGREMCRQIKADESLGGMKVIVMTSLFTSVKYQNEAFKTYKVDDYLAKPVQFNLLRDLLQKHLG